MTPPMTASNRRAFLCPASVTSLNSSVARRSWLLTLVAASADLVANSAESRTTCAKDWYCWYARWSTVMPTCMGFSGGGLAAAAG